MSQPRRSPIAWPRRLETHVAAASALLIATSLGAVLVATSRLVTNQSLRRGSEDLAVARAAFNRLMAARAEAAAVQVQLLIAQPLLRARLAETPLAQDLEILRTMADEYPRQLHAEFCIVTDRRGAWLAMPGWPAGATAPEGLRSAIRAAAEGRGRSGVVSIDARLFLVVSEPARFADETLGTMTAGLALDDAVAHELADVTHSEVTLVSGTRLSASSLHGERRGQLVRHLERRPASGAASAGFQQLGGTRYVSGTFPLTADSTREGEGRLVLLRDWTPTEQVLAELTREFVAAGIIVFACALAGSFAFSRRMSRPFQDIAAAARDIADGNWTRQVPLRGRGEAMTMAAAFNEMSVSLRHWHDEARAKSERLTASYERFHSVTESARDAIVSTDKEGGITFWNRSAAMTFGYEESEAIGKPLTDLIAAPDRTRYLEAFAATGAGVGSGPGHIVEMMGLRRDGGTFPIELSLSARAAEGPTQVTAVVRDITERKHAQEALRQRDEQLQQAQKMEAIGRLAGGVAHDFNNLLTAIIGFGGLVKESLDPDDPLQSDMGEVLNAAQHATDLTRQLLAFSRRQVVTPQVVALDRIVVTTERMLRRLIGEDVTLSSTFAPDLGRVRADPGQIEQVLINLCVNARDAMPDGGELTIELANTEIDAVGAAAHAGLEPGRYVRLSVRDTGSGIAPDVIDHIFEPFFTTKVEGKGTGLGLAMVYGIAKHNGGHVEVESCQGQGTAFRVYFPRVDDGDAVAQPPRVAPSTADVSETVLLVEDDRRVRDLVASALRRRGYIVLQAADGEEALRVARNYAAPIHLLLSDVVMPGMSGRTVAARMTELRPRTRVLLMSGYADDPTLRGGIEASTLPFIHKPFSVNALADKIREVLSAAVA